MMDANAQNISGIIDKGMLILGIKGNNLPSLQEKTIMINELVNHYKNLKIGELDLAFLLAVRGQLDIEVETYQNFSVLYLNRLISSYMRWAAKHLHSEKPKIEESAWMPRTVEDEEKIDLAFESYQKFKDFEAIVFGLDVFKILHKRNLIVMDIDSIYQKTLDAMNKKMFSLEGIKRSDYAAKFKDEDYMENQCRRMAVAIYFDKKLKA